MMYQGVNVEGLEAYAEPRKAPHTFNLIQGIFHLPV